MRMHMLHMMLTTAPSFSLECLPRRTGETMVIKTKEYIQMKEGNVVKPYRFVKMGAVEEFRFCPNYNNISTVLSKCTRLLSAHKGRARNKTEIIAKITEEHQETIEFDTGWLDDMSEKIVLKTAADRVTPLVSNPGRVVISSAQLYLQPFNNVESEPVQKFPLTKITRVIKRRYLLSQRGLEIFLGDDDVLFLSFSDAKKRDEFYFQLSAQADVQLTEEVKGNIMLKWQNGEISNYDYLMHLNNFADRSFNDLTQYPVFPWVIADYTSEKLDLAAPETFRDLSKPIGALNPKRLAGWKQRFEDMPEPKFLYGTHYSSPGYVLFYTVRVAPEYTLCLQAGKYDHADRMFCGIDETWQNVLNGGADVKELIPEFYKGDGSFLLNGQRLSLGTRQETGERVGDVKLPPWAESSADFVAKSREALESEHVSAHLHEWIDLIFGSKQLGADAIAADNVFYPLTYEGAVNLDEVTDPVELESLQAQITEFGQTPKQLFQIPHPPRSVAITGGGGGGGSGGTATGVGGASDGAATDGGDGTAAAAGGGGGEDDSGAGTAASSGTAGAAGTAAADANAAAGGGEGAILNWGGYVELELRTSQKLHRDAVSAVVVSGDEKTMHSVSNDGTLTIYSLEEARQMQAGNVSEMALSSVLPLDDGKTVMVASWDNNVYWFDTDFGRVTTTLSGHDDAVSQCERVDDLLITASWDSSVKIWKYEDAASGSCRFADECLVAELEGLDGEVHCMAIHRGRRLIAAAGATDGMVMVWQMSDNEVMTEIEAHDDQVYDVAFSPDGNRLITSGNDGFVKVFDIDHGGEIVSYEVESDLRCLAFDGQHLLGGAEDGSIALWDVVQGTLLATHSGKHSAAVRTITVSEDGRRVTTGSEDQTICHWGVGPA